MYNVNEEVLATRHLPLDVTPMRKGLVLATRGGEARREYLVQFDRANALVTCGEGDLITQNELGC